MSSDQTIVQEDMPTVNIPKASISSVPSANSPTCNTMKRMSRRSLQPSQLEKALSVSSAATRAKGDGSMLKIRTCWGTIELSWLRTLSLLSLLVNFAAFCLLVAILAEIYVSQKNNDFTIVEYTVDAARFRDLITHGVKSATMYSLCLPLLNTSSIAGNLTNAEFTQKMVAKEKAIFDRYYARFGTFLDKVFNLLTSEDIQSLNFDTRDYTNATSLLMETEIMGLVNQGRSFEAFSILMNSTYQSISETTNKLEPIVKYVNEKELNINKKLTDESLASLVVVCVSMSIVIPVVILTLICALNRDSVHRRRLRKAKAIMLLDTLSDANLRELFKAHCVKEFSSENFNCLVKIASYKQLCDKSWEIKTVLYDDNKSVSSGGDTTSVTGSVASSVISDETTKKKNKKQKNMYSECDLEEVEKQKSEVAFEIYSEFLELHGEQAVNISKKLVEPIKTEIDACNNKEHGIVFLSDSLFDTVEQELAIVMLDSHQRFKQSMAFQRKMKIANINNKVRAQKNVNKH